MTPPIRVPKEAGNKIQGRAIEIVVGDERKVYCVHEALVRASSSFFDRAMAGDWKESAERTIELPEDEPKTFALYVHWLYYGTLPVFCDDEPGPSGDSEYLNLAKAYVLGDKLMDAQFQDAAIDAIIEKSRSIANDGEVWFPGEEVIEYAYNNTTDLAPLRELLVDFYVHHGDSSWLDNFAEPENVPHLFLLRLASKLLDRKAVSEEPIEASNYHTDGVAQQESQSADQP